MFTQLFWVRGKYRVSVILYRALYARSRPNTHGHRRQPGVQSSFKNSTSQLACRLLSTKQLLGAMACSHTCSAKLRSEGLKPQNSCLLKPKHALSKVQSSHGLGPFLQIALVWKLTADSPFAAFCRAEPGTMPSPPKRARATAILCTVPGSCILMGSTQSASCSQWAKCPQSHGPQTISTTPSSAALRSHYGSCSAEPRGWGPLGGP